MGNHALDIQLESGRACSSLPLWRKHNKAIKNTALHVIKKWTQILVLPLFGCVPMGKHFISISPFGKSSSWFLECFDSHGLLPGYFTYSFSFLCWLLFLSYALDVTRQSILHFLFFPFPPYIPFSLVVWVPVAWERMHRELHTGPLIFQLEIWLTDCAHSSWAEQIQGHI